MPGGNRSSHFFPAKPNLPLLSGSNGPLREWDALAVASVSLQARLEEVLGKPFSEIALSLEGLPYSKLSPRDWSDDERLAFEELLWVGNGPDGREGFEWKLSVYKGAGLSKFGRSLMNLCWKCVELRGEMARVGSELESMELALPSGQRLPASLAADQGLSLWQPCLRPPLRKKVGHQGNEGAGLPLSNHLWLPSLSKVIRMGKAPSSGLLTQLRARMLPARKAPEQPQAPVFIAEAPEKTFKAPKEGSWGPEPEVNGTRYSRMGNPVDGYFLVPEEGSFLRKGRASHWDPYDRPDAQEGPTEASGF